ncbi:NHLP leader peptide family natural product precursor [Nostoc sp. FACHB-87]|uniref:NHLP leader peptide family RiPP precursor n=1 Tax=Nostocales TaxID=1161 RepID=UPI001682BEEC|nr:MULTISPECIES: NHLP leader peptide family RiPP precursor [Nostocales]MBD2299668.1 NHLP leader peptide family natural product precursor [Nostoc sp. FACHB-190]MBD2457484.1 NHLP leader peptide family natural product precursor [Nostoc sp. FACHB-87]MBD2477548.1 NHLP leader peptide family natural product precursor [Anabaena sp. FACHB-83]MBD2489575.1 NHLP leader peptide family natural product precursor [Aulosira sp. FACHB-615]
MTTNSEEFNPTTLEDRIIAKAMEDSAYKQRLLSDAKAVVEEELGEKLGDDVTIQVLQQSANHLYLVLPIDIDQLVREGIISQEELEAVAGGGVVSRLSAKISIHPGNVNGQTRNFKNIEASLKSAVAALTLGVLSQRHTTRPK